MVFLPKWRHRSEQALIGPRFTPLPTGINWELADRALEEGLAEGRAALAHIRRGRGMRCCGRAHWMLYERQRARVRPLGALTLRLRCRLTALRKP